MASEIVVGMFDSSEDAEFARAALIAKGVPEDRIGIEKGDRRTGDESRAPDAPLPEDRGIAGFIGRMFSGALMDDANIEKYTHDWRNGRSILVVRIDSDEQRQAASSALSRSGPRIYSLPNAPTAWSEASRNDPASIGGVDRDPARPEGLLTDVEGLPVASDEARLAGRSGSRRRDR